MIAPVYVMWGVFENNTLLRTYSNLKDAKSWADYYQGFRRQSPTTYSVKQLNVFVAERKENNDNC